MPTKAMWKAISLAAPLMLATPVWSQTCGPDVDGRVAEVSYRDSSILWDPVVEFDKVVLTIGGPCEDIVKVFGRGEPIFFDLREIERVGDGAYTWELRRVATVSAATKKALAESRKTGDDRIWWGLWQQGAIPQGPYVDSASFLVVNGVIVPPDQAEGKSKGPAIASPEAPAQFSHKVVLTNNNGVIRNSSCVGFDCPDSPTFGDTTILLMENNTRIKFDDTSVTAGFPNNDWEVQANSSASGGGNFFAVNDCANSSQGDCADDPLFKVEAGARANALYVESDGDIGAGTANPVLDLHLVNGDTPGMRLDQNGSGGFTAQVWDVAGNEANFFVRDVTGGSTLPFRIRPGAPSSSIDIASDGDVGIGTASPDAKLEVEGSNGSTKVEIEETNVTTLAREILEMRNNGDALIIFTNTAGGVTRYSNGLNGTSFIIDNQGNGGVEYTFGGTGNLTAAGSMTATAFNVSSDRNLKEAIEPVRGGDVLARLASMPISTWTFKTEDTRHMGPMAQDFAAAFGLGTDNTHISLADMAGVSLAAVQAMNEVVQEKDKEIAELKSRLETLEKLVHSLARDR